MDRKRLEQQIKDMESESESKKMEVRSPHLTLCLINGAER